jgi:hypothetical protein
MPGSAAGDCSAGCGAIIGRHDHRAGWHGFFLSEEEYCNGDDGGECDRQQGSEVHYESWYALQETGKSRDKGGAAYADGADQAGLSSIG